jgi:acyl-coenzyme A synthetase/AMP-(fatty) acid ligase
MPRNSPISLWSAITAGGSRSLCAVAGVGGSASWGELASGLSAEDWGGEFRGRSVVVAMTDQLAGAGAMVQLDGVARRMVLCPSDLPREYLTAVANTAGADVVLTDEPALESIDPRMKCVSPGSGRIGREVFGRSSEIETEWILLTSGTTGGPKLVRHTLASLTGAIVAGEPPPAPIVWSTFYDIRRYGGLQIFLRAALMGSPLVLPGAQEPTAEFLARAGAHGVTHISGTPSHWRRALMSGEAGKISPEYVRLSGEIADQGILNQLRLQYPQAKIAHAFASTEAGVAFVVNDGFSGFPVEALTGTPGVEMKVEEGTLRIRSERTSAGYLGEDSPAMKDEEGFVDTGDALELRDGRYFFVGRRDGVVNVGGLKVHPEEVEAVINRHPLVSMSLVKTKKNPITGALVVADVVLKTPLRTAGSGAQDLQRDILSFCRGELAAHKVPVAINFVPALAVAESGKLVRPNA